MGCNVIYQLKDGSVPFRKFVKRNEQGSYFLGTLFIILEVAGAFADGSALRIGLAGIKVRLTKGNLAPRIDFPGEQVKLADGTTKWVDYFAPANVETRAKWTAAIFAIPQVAAARQEAVEAEQLHQLEFRAAQQRYATSGAVPAGQPASATPQPGCVSL